MDDVNEFTIFRNTEFPVDESRKIGQEWSNCKCSRLYLLRRYTTPFARNTTTSKAQPHEPRMAVALI